MYYIFPDRFRNGDPTNDYCVSGSTSGCPSFYGAGLRRTLRLQPGTRCSAIPYSQSSGCYNNFGSIFYGGDLLGVQNELDYVQSFGFDTFYLTPIFQASSNHRYDTDDYLNVDPALGGNAAFASLVTEMNHRGMRVILDGVFNHASSDSKYFNRYNRFPDVGACQSLSSPYRTWFHFNDNNVPCTSADYPGWDGTDSLPTFDHTQTAVQNFFYADPTNSVMAQVVCRGRERLALRCGAGSEFSAFVVGRYAAIREDLQERWTADRRDLAECKPVAGGRSTRFDDELPLPAECHGLRARAVQLDRQQRQRQRFDHSADAEPVRYRESRSARRLSASGDVGDAESDRLARHESSALCPDGRRATRV